MSELPQPHQHKEKSRVGSGETPKETKSRTRSRRNCPENTVMERKIITLKCKNKECGKEFAIAARKTARKPKQQFPVDEVTIVEYACCPYCLCTDLEVVKE